MSALYFIPRDTDVYVSGHLARENYLCHFSSGTPGEKKPRKDWMTEVHLENVHYSGDR